MPNNYFQFSESLVFKPEALDWITTWLKKADDLSGDETDDKEFLEVFPQWNDYLNLGFSWNLELGDLPVSLWIHDDGGEGHLECLIPFVSSYLKKFDPKGSFKVEWAETCGSPRAGEFGGGAVIITATEIYSMSTGRWVQEQQELIQEPWKDDGLQFARLLCELVANVDNLELEKVAESMDLGLSDVKELLDRADKVWEEAKTAVAGPEVV